MKVVIYFYHISAFGRRSFPLLRDILESTYNIYIVRQNVSIYSTRTRHGAGSLSSFPSRTSLRLPSLLSRRGSSKRRLTSESPATIKARACDERGRLTSHSTSGTNSGTGDSRVSRKLVNFRTLTWQSSQGESKEDSGPPTF